MDKYRLRFRKTGRAIYISHLDLMQVIQRSFSRAELELKYSEGFNPHPQISIALPMSLGTASLCEILDFKLKTDVEPSRIPALLNAALPEGIEVMECYEPQNKITGLKYLQVVGRFEYDTRSADEMAEGLSRFYERAEIVITRRTKRGEGESDIRAAIHSIAFTPSDTRVKVEAVISAQEPTLNPELLVQALIQKQPELSPDFAMFTRIETFDENMEIYR